MKDTKVATVGLFSFHKEYNYGTMLQAYALYQSIKYLGFNAEYISFSQGKANSLRKKIKTATILFFKDFSGFQAALTNKKPNNFWNSPEFELTKKAFDEFHNKFIPHTESIYTPENYFELIPLYNKFVVGSDQTWSPYRYSKKNPLFLSFIDNGKLKHAYAPSIGTSNFPEDLKDLYRKELGDFNHISCREKAGCVILESILKRPIEYVLDPTLLLTADQWDELSLNQTISEKYILCYFLGNRSYVQKFAEKLSQETSLPIYYIVTTPHYLQFDNCLLGVGPRQFTSLIKNAEYVCTDSYHGTLFSINYQKTFYSFMKREGGLEAIDNSRILDILSNLNISNRFKLNNDFSFEQEIDYTKVTPIINKLRDASKRFLKSILDS